MNNTKNVTKKGTDEFKEVAFIMETYKQLCKELERDLSEMREATEREEREAKRTVQNLRRDVEIAEGDNWNCKLESERANEVRIPRNKMAAYVAIEKIEV